MTNSHAPVVITHNPSHDAGRVLRWIACAALGLLCTLVCACGTPTKDVAAQPGAAFPSARLLLYGEEHDQPDQQRQVADAVTTLGARGELGALVLEMAERGHDTRGLPRNASEADVQTALAWAAAGWPWATYRGVVMAAVRAGVPVYGGNLPRSGMSATMEDASLDRLVPGDVSQLLTQAIDRGHCGLMPASQLPYMLRIQLARDESMAKTLRDAAAANAGKVVMLAGAEHVMRDRGVPLHLARLAPDLGLHVTLFNATADAPADERRKAAVTPTPDRCEALRKRQAKMAN